LIYVHVDKRILIIDCQLAGVAGDMMVGALLDFGVDIDGFTDAMETAGQYIRDCKGLEIQVEEVSRRGFKAKRLHVRSEEHGHHIQGFELRDAVENFSQSIGLSPEARALALRSIDSLIEAEAKIHGESPREVHLHEAGTVDTVVDVVGSAYALEELGLLKDTKIYSTPVAVGGGLFKFSHGTVPSPAPATLEILRSKGFPMVGGSINFELATPTGVALLVNMVEEALPFYPAVKPKVVGYGAGAKDFKEIPNVLRITSGEPLNYQLLRDEISVLETNLDDVTGEVIGYTVERLLQEGAKDVTIIPMFTKKNRPGQILKIIADRTDAERLSRVLIEETGTLGVRVYPCERHILNRESIPVDILIDDVKEFVNVKVAKDSKGEIVQLKPEYDDVKRVANKTNKPLREIMELIKMKAREVLLKR
jgi:hypothetical protein